MTANVKPSTHSGTLTLFSGGSSSETVGQAQHANDESRNLNAEVVGVASQSLSREMSLFEIDECLCLLMEAASENDGEIPQDLQQALLDYCEAFGEKVDNIARYIRSQEFQAANASAEIEL